MTFVVTENCIKCKYTDCVEVCPVDCFYEGENMLVIHPDECIDCGACVPECPTEAIFSEDDLPEKWAEYVELNAKLADLTWERFQGMSETFDRSNSKPCSKPAGLLVLPLNWIRHVSVVYHAWTPCRDRPCHRIGNGAEKTSCVRLQYHCQILTMVITVIVMNAVKALP